MSRTQNKTEEPIRTIQEFRRRYLPESYEREMAEQEREDSDPAGVDLVTGLLEDLRRRLAEQKRRAK